MPIQLEISPRIIPNIASLYNDVNRIFLEYIDNSLDSAEPFYDRSKNKYSRPINITIAVIGKSYREKEKSLFMTIAGELRIYPR